MYSEKDFERCMFNPMVKKGMLESHPRLREIVSVEDEQQFHCDLILRYICALYDKKSPLVFDEKDLNHRKSLAADVAGFDPEVDEPFLQTLYDSENDFAVNISIRFLIRFMEDRLWGMIVSNEFTFWEYTKRLMKPAVGDSDKEELQAIDIKSKVSEELEKTHKRLKEYYKEFFGDDAGFEKAGKGRRMTPESVSKLN